MLINWFTVGAQVVNFLILVWLMRRYLYRPILAAIDARAEQVKGVLANADKKMSDATSQLKNYQQRIKNFDDGKSKREAELDEVIKTQRQIMVQSVADDADKARLAELADLRAHQAAFAAQLGQLVQAEAQAVARSTMTDLADADLEHRIVTMFMRRLGTLEVSSARPLAEALKQSPSSASITTSFKVSDADRGLLTNAVNVFASASVTLAFNTSPANICGIELCSQGQRAGWSMADYLKGLAERSAQLLAENFPEDKEATTNPVAVPEGVQAPGAEEDSQSKQLKPAAH